MALDRVGAGLQSAIKSGSISGKSKCSLSIIGQDKESWKAVRLEFNADRPIDYKVEMRDAIAQYPRSEMCTVQPYNVKLYGLKATKPIFVGTITDAILHMSKSWELERSPNRD